MRLATMALIAALILGCTTTRARDSKPLDSAGAVGTEAEQKAFAGLWSGTLDAVDPALSGPIHFRLEGGGAFFAQLARSPRKVAWLKFSGGRMAGATDTWFDPERKATVYTMFEATLDDGVMHGVVRENVDGKWTDSGRFTATRVGD